jgi:hypothetical protein
MLGPLPVTALADGVQASVEMYQALAKQGRLDPAQHGLEPAPVGR